MSASRLAACVGLVLLLSVSASFAELVGAEPKAEWRLPARLAEVSALAMTNDQRLFAVDDERAIVYQIDYDDGRLVKAFALGSEPLREDFEGLAIIDRQFFLLTSDARLFMAAEGEDGERMPFTVSDTGLGDECEFEGLAADEDGDLLLLCKNVRKGAAIDVVSVFRWRPAEQHTVGRVPLPVKAIREALGKRRFRPSGIALHPRREALVIVAARERALVEVAVSGELLNAVLLPGEKRHRQTEGIEFTARGDVILADEANQGPPQLTIYGATTNKNK